MSVEVTPNDGVAVRDVALNGRYMARSISVPYFTIATSTTGGAKRGELKPNSNDPIRRSRLVDYIARDLGIAVVIYAHYIVDRISPTSDSCLHVEQLYWFWATFSGDACEPSGTLPCTRFEPLVHYKFESKGGEVLYSFDAVQRNEFAVNGSPFNSIGIFRDCDSPLGIGCFLKLKGYVFKYKWNPLKIELKARVMQGGHDFGTWDNIHQTYNRKIFDEPGVDFRRLPPVSGGCPECVHMHWRWGRAIPVSTFGDGRTEFYYPQSNQDMDIAIVK